MTSVDLRWIPSILQKEKIERRKTCTYSLFTSLKEKPTIEGKVRRTNTAIINTISVQIFFVRNFNERKKV